MGRRQFGTVRELGSGRWQARYWDLRLGRRVNAPRTFASKADAHRWLAATETDLARGVLGDPKAQSVTFEEWAEDWLTSKPDKRAASIARDRAALRTHIYPAIGHVKVIDITVGHIRAVMAAMRERKLSPKSVRTYLGTVTAIFNAAVDADLITRSPVRAMHLEKGRRRKRPDITPAQFRRLIDELPTYYRTLVLVAGALGLRWSEVIALRPADIDFEQHTLTVNQTVEEVAGHIRVVDATKSESSHRTMSVPKSVLREVALHIATCRPEIAADDLIFIGPRGGILRRHFLARTLKPAAERAGIEIGPRTGLDFHGLRHLATTMMVTNGEHPRVMQTRLGHATPTLTLGLYAHVPNELDRAAADRLDELLRRPPAPENSPSDNSD